MERRHGPADDPPEDERKDGPAATEGPTPRPHVRNRSSACRFAGRFEDERLATVLLPLDPGAARWAMVRSCLRGRQPKLPRIAKGEFSAQFALALALKDVHLALRAADEDAFVALGCLADEWQQVVDQGLGDQDVTIVARSLEHRGETS